MRRLGETPLTGAQNQRRRREKIKAQLVEADVLEARQSTAAGEIPGLTGFYQNLLRELGASPEESTQICEAAATLQDDIVALLRKRGQAALDALRRQRPPVGSSLLARLAAMQEQG